MNKIELGL